MIVLDSCIESNQRINSLNKGEKIRLSFLPAFHDDLNIEFEIFTEDSIEVTLRQNTRVIVYDSIAYLGNNTYEDISFGDYSKATLLVKPNFQIDYILDRDEFMKYQNIIKKIDNYIKKQDTSQYFGGEDGIVIEFERIVNDDTIKRVFWSPSSYSGIGEELIKLLELISQNQNRIVERTCEKIKLYLDGERWIFKTISEDPLLIKVLYLPSCPCQSKVTDFVKTLPKADQIFIDITNYGFYEKESEDLSCLEQVLKMKYNKVRWIMNSDDFKKFENLNRYK